MIWQKLGLIISTKQIKLTWGKMGLLTPTPVLLNDKIIRVFAGFRDQEGISRIGYVDVSAQDPSKIIKVSSKPVLDIGLPGCFDDAGVILGDIVKVKNKYHMYYVGFQIPKKAKFMAFTGLAISKNLSHFDRYSEAPVLDRSSGALMINALHSLVKIKKQYRAFVACGSGWETIRGHKYPQYEIYSLTSKDGVRFNNDYKLMIPNNKRCGEYRIGRPSVFKHRNKYHMFFTKGTVSGADYFPGYASSSNSTLTKWKRKDANFNLKLGPEEYDQHHLCYPRYIHTKYGTYLFYNGNNMGFEGIAAAKLVKE